ncbi:MAG: hypothetical protein AAF388_17775 [Bacteroidota bacterium]
MAKETPKNQRKTTRLFNWNYGWNAVYFITIITKNRYHYFGQVENGQMVLSQIGVIADVLWHEIPYQAPFAKLGAFMVMPNHIHGILGIDKVEKYNTGISNSGKDNACIVPTEEDKTQLSSSQKRF